MTSPIRYSLEVRERGQCCWCWSTRVNIIRSGRRSPRWRRSSGVRRRRCATGCDRPVPLPRKSYAAAGFVRCSRAQNLSGLFANHPVSIPVPHEPVGRMLPVHRRDAVLPRLLARDSSVPVRVPLAQRVACAWRCCARCRLSHLRLSFGHDHFGRDATRQDALQSLSLPPVDRQPVLPLHRDDPAREPAAVHPRHPLAGVLPALLVSVHRRRRQRQVPQVGREPVLRGRVCNSQPAVVSFGRSRGDVFVRCLSLGGWRSGVPCTGRTPGPHARDDAHFDGL